MEAMPKMHLAASRAPSMSKSEFSGSTYTVDWMQYVRKEPKAFSLRFTLAISFISN